MPQSELSFSYPKNIKPNLIKYTMKLSASKLSQDIPGSKDLQEFISKNEEDLEKWLSPDNDKGRELVSNIMLPLPNELQETIGHDFDTEKGLASSVVEHFDLISSFQEKVNKIFSQVSNTLGKRKPLIDPALMQNYTGTQPRSFNFSYTFIPESSEEARNIFEIIRVIKQYSAPSTVVKSALIMSPYVWKIELGNKYLDDSIRFHEGFITNIDVTYGSSGGSIFTKDGYPKSINMSLTFMETRLKYQEEWK